MIDFNNIITNIYEQNILVYINSLKQYPIKLVSLILDIVIVVSRISIIKNCKRFKGLAISKRNSTINNCNCT